MPGGQGGGCDQPLLLPTGEGAGAPLGAQRHPAAGFFDAAADLFRRKGEVLAAKGQLVLHPLVDDLCVGVLQHHTRPAANVAYPLTGYVLAADVHLAGKRPLGHVGDDARQDGQHRTFPLPRIAVQQGKFSVFQRKGGVFQHRLRHILIAEGHIFELNGSHSSTAPMAHSALSAANAPSLACKYTGRYTVYGAGPVVKPRVSTLSASVSDRLTSRTISGIRKAR